MCNDLVFNSVKSVESDINAPEVLYAHDHSGRQLSAWGLPLPPLNESSVIIRAAGTAKRQSAVIQGVGAKAFLGA